MNGGEEAIALVAQRRRKGESANQASAAGEVFLPRTEYGLGSNPARLLGVGCIKSPVFSKAYPAGYSAFRMAFGWSFPKVMIIVSAAFLLFGVPLMTLLIILKERRRKKEFHDE